MARKTVRKTVKKTTVNKKAAVTKKATATKKTDTLSDIRDLQNFSNGKLDDATITKIEKLEVLLGVKQMNAFGTNDVRIFDRNMREMTQADLRKLCEKVGLFPSGQRHQLVANLRKEFIRRTNGARSISMQIDTPIFDPSHPDYKKVKDLMMP